MGVGSTGILKYFKPVSQVGSSSSSTTQTLPDSDGPLSERFQLKPNHRQLGHRKLYVYEPRVYCTFTREFTSGHGLMCTVMITLGSRYSLQCFVSCFDILVHLVSPKFYSRPAACIRWPKFLLHLPNWWFAKVFLPMQYFWWFTKVLCCQRFALYGKCIYQL